MRLNAAAPDGTRLRYVVAGSGPPAVLVGGKTSSIESAWWRYLPLLSREFKVIALDNRGAGESDKPDVPYSTSLMAGDALAVLQATGETSAHWVGISLGGMILQELALSHAAAVRSLILIATHCGGEEKPAPLPADQDAALAGHPFRRLAHLYTTEFLLAHRDWVAQDVEHFGKMPLHAIHRQDQAVRHHDTCALLGQITTPVLIVHGRQDRMVPVRRAEELARLLPHSELLILDPAGHQVHSEQMEAVVSAIVRFVGQVESRP